MVLFATNERGLYANESHHQTRLGGCYARCDDLLAQTQGVECRKDKGVIDEIPSAYKDIQQVMDNQSDLVTIEAELKQVLCVKG